MGTEPLAGARALRLGVDDGGDGWVIFAATMLLVLGTVNMGEGIAAISGSHVFAPTAHYFVGDLKSWGWVTIVNGAVQVLAGLGILIRNQSARWLGVLLAVVNAVVQMLFIEAYPWWSLLLFAVDLLVVYALVVHGGLRFRPV